MDSGLGERHAITVLGDGARDVVFAHGFGCDQNMWRFVAPALSRDYRVVLYDLMGAGRSRLGDYDFERYQTLHGHARDLVAIARAYTRPGAVFVGHSVAATIGLLAGIEAPELFGEQVMVGPSPCYVNDGSYVGGFSAADIDALLETLDSNFLGWASAVAPTIMGAPDRPELSEELSNSFCRTDPRIARHFARVTFTSDHRDDLPKLGTRTLIMQCTDDLIAPQSVGRYMARVMPRAELRLIDNIGHCPHLSAPDEVAVALREFLRA